MSDGSETVTKLAAQGGKLATAGEVELRVAAVPEQLPVVRSVAGVVAMRADFDLDAIADLKLAVDEACSTLITLAESGEVMVCRLAAVEDDEFEFTVSVPSDREPSQETFGWRVLCALADEVTAWTEAPDGAQLAYIRLARRKHAPDTSPGT